MKRWEWALLTEGVAVMIAMVMPVTPSKTGSDWSLAEIVYSEPTYLQEVFVYFVFTNLLVLIVGAAVVLWVRLQEKGQP